MAKKKKSIVIILLVLLVLAGTGGYAAYQFYFSLNKPGVHIAGADKADLYITTGSSVEEVFGLLKENNYLINEQDYLRTAQVEKFDKVYPGHYVLTNNMSYRSLVRMLKTGRQTPIKLTIAGNIRDINKIASIVSARIEADSLSIIALLSDPKRLEEYNLKTEDVLGVIIPNTYEFYWNRNADEWLKRMLKEYDAFWNDQRKEKLAATGLTRQQAIALASIVNEETAKTSEMARIAGVYINRVNRGMKLQADPTVKYAVGDWTLKRVYNRHTETVSPYNTYYVFGLPPGPICVPTIAAIDGVLNYEKHDYLYFCAKADMTGYHEFSRTLSQHNRYASAFHAAQNRLKIY